MKRGRSSAAASSRHPCGLCAQCPEAQELLGKRLALVWPVADTVPPLERENVQASARVRPVLRSTMDCALELGRVAFRWEVVAVHASWVNKALCFWMSVQSHGVRFGRTSTPRLFTGGCLAVELLCKTIAR